MARNDHQRQLRFAVGVKNDLSPVSTGSAGIPAGI
jgi:hypothetical protein